MCRIVPESPRWLLAVGRTSEAKAILTKAAEKNRIPLGKVTAAIEAYNDQVKVQKEQEIKYNITHLFRTPNLRIKTLCVCANWFVCGLCFFGLVQYMGRLAGNIFVNTAVSGKKLLYSCYNIKPRFNYICIILLLAIHRPDWLLFTCTRYLSDQCIAVLSKPIFLTDNENRNVTYSFLETLVT